MHREHLLNKYRGTYALILALDSPATITVGKLGTFCFSPGYYVYIGSALNGIAARIGRHFRGSEKLRWHIDYLRKKAGPAEVWYVESPERLECDWDRAAACMPGAGAPVKGFGASDCHCYSHLVYFDHPPSSEDFCLRLGARGHGIGTTKQGRFSASPVSLLPPLSVKCRRIT